MVYCIALNTVSRFKKERSIKVWDACVNTHLEKYNGLIFGNCYQIILPLKSDDLQVLHVNI